MKKDKQQKNNIRSLALFSVIIGDLLAFTGAGMAIGYLVWKKIGAPQWIIMFTALLGLGAAMWQLYRISQRDSNEDK
ncbi:MAG: hypothetical protein AAB116_09075 [Candidatus Poribacteria bacterium]